MNTEIKYCYFNFFNLINIILFYFIKIIIICKNLIKIIPIKVFKKFILLSHVTKKNGNCKIKKE